MLLDSRHRICTSYRMKILSKHFLPFAALLASALIATGNATASADSRLDSIIERGYIRIGTTGDFKPFTYFNPQTNAYEGIDIDAARDMADALGVEARFVASTWSTLVGGILDDHYDVAVGGVTRTLSRQVKVSITEPYFEVGKCPLVRSEDRNRLTSIEALNQPEVRVGVNPGGTNERFVIDFLPRATVTVVPDNLAIPGRVLSGEFDVMMTDNVEAMLFEAQMPGLSAVNPLTPFTREDFGYLLPRDEAALLDWMNLWVHQSLTKGKYEKWKSKWISE